MNTEALNPNLADLDIDYLYHLGLDSSMDLKAMFGDVQFVCMGGSPVRAEDFARKAAETLGVEVYEGGGLQQDVRQGLREVLRWVGKNLPLRAVGKTERCSLYKVGPIISVSHGMGMPSMSIFLHELTKLLHYAGVDDAKFIRIGTSGGVGVQPGTVVITEQGINGMLQPEFEQVVLGEKRVWPTTLSGEMFNDILACHGGVRTILGKTMGTNDFYEGQGRLDGALKPGYDPSQKMDFLRRAYEAGVRNIEMESTEFAAFCLRAGIPAAIVCAALLNRLEGDQVTSTPAQLAEFSDNAQRVVLEYMRRQLSGSLNFDLKLGEQG